MSLPVFPTFDGVGWDIKKSPVYNTIVQESASGMEFRTPLYAQPRWKFTLPLGYLHDDTLGSDAQKLFGFIMQTQGQYGAFLYTDPYDNTVTNWQVAVCDGVTSSFPLTRPVGSMNSPEVVMQANVTSLTLNGSPAGSHTLTQAPATVTFGSAPTSGTLLAWSGTFQFLCRFTKDDTELTHLMQGFWDGELEFQSLLLPTS